MTEIHKTISEDPARIEECHRFAVPDLRDYSLYDQIGYLTLILLAGASLIIARILQPSSRGVGTHEQLGLPPCPFLHLTGIPCPSCGLTTSFAHAARLDFSLSLITQPFGLIVFCLTTIAIPLSIYFIRRRIPWSEITYARSFDRMIYMLIVVYILCWFYKIIAMKWLFAGSYSL
ncbi:MAG: DUF2752 domain-containing protein [Acidobacteria bacterium]|nr:DUF2752 domain-containing protein [Acidobacteriota bacterium]